MLLPTTPWAWTYVVAVAGSAGVGFATGSTPPIVLAALLALPMSLVALPAYYVVYELLAQIPEANPDTATGSASCGPHGDCRVSTTGDLATWFAITTGVVGTLALIAAALLNVAILRSVVAARRQRHRTSRPRP
jgi:hypothetical protein